MCSSDLSKLPDKEWSGVLYYKYKGSFKNKNLTLTAVDFLVLDIGNSTHTEFVESPEIISYMCANGLINCQLGLIHSHNTMKTFFSGEDSDTLTKEGSARNHFLSLIVNNAGNYVAAITRRVVIESAKAVRTYNTFGDVEVKQTINNATFDEYVEIVCGFCAERGYGQEHGCRKCWRKEQEWCVGRRDRKSVV